MFACPCARVDSRWFSFFMVFGLRVVPETFSLGVRGTVENRVRAKFWCCYQDSTMSQPGYWKRLLLDLFLQSLALQNTRVSLCDLNRSVGAR